MSLESSTLKKVKPFSFSKLPKISRREIELREALLHYLPFSLPLSTFHESVQTFLSEQYSAPVRVKLEKIKQETVSVWMERVPEICQVALLGVEPVASKAFLWVDTNLGFSLIDRTLGGKGDAPAEIRELTSIEEGIFQYLLLKFIGEVYALSQESSAVHFRIEEIKKNKKELQSFKEDQTLMVSLHYRVEVGSTVGFVVLALPHPYLEQYLLMRSPMDVSDDTKDYQYLLKRLASVGFVKAELRVEVGSVTLMASEKNQLEKGDVVLFDQTFGEWSGNRLSGNVVLKVGSGKEGGFLAQLISADAPLLVKILDYYGGEG